MLRYTEHGQMGTLYGPGRRYYVRLGDGLVLVSRYEYYTALLKVNTSKKEKK